MVLRVLAVVLVLAVAATAATYARYESLHPCDWLERDMALALDAPSVVARMRIKAAFLLQGIAEPGADDCVSEWWSLRANGPAAGSRPGD